jgi:polyisoprenoid-binding protein YceI
MLLPELSEDSRDHFSNRPHTVREILLIDERGQRAARSRTGCREVEEMPCHALSDRRKRVSGELFEDIVQPMNRLFRERPRHGCIAARRSFHSPDIEEKRCGGCDGLHKHRRGSANECRHTQEIARPYIPHGDLAPVAGMHVHAKQTLQDDGQSLRGRFGVHGLSGWEFDDPSTVDQRFDRCNRDRSPTSASEQSQYARGREVLEWLIWYSPHRDQIRTKSVLTSLDAIGEGSPMLLKRQIVRCIPLLLLGVVLTACGGSEATRQETPQASGSATSEHATAARHRGVRTFVIVPAESKASYVADEELFALAFTKFGLSPGWAKVVGSTQAIEGQFQIDMEQPAASLGSNEFVVRMNTFRTGRDMRDNWIRENGPRFNDYPVATFRATAIDGVAGSDRPGAELSFSLRGTLTIREIARPATFAVRARLTGDTLDGDATTRLLMSSFGIATITFHNTLTVADEIGLDVHFRARAEREAGGAR